MRTLDSYKTDIANNMEEYDPDATNFLTDEDMAAKFINCFNAALSTITQLKREGAITAYSLSQNIAEPTSDASVFHPETEYTLPADCFQIKKIYKIESNRFIGPLYRIVANKLRINSYFQGTLRIEYYRKISSIDTNTAGATLIDIPAECEQLLIYRVCAMLDRSGDNYDQYMADYANEINNLPTQKTITIVEI